MTNTFSFSKRHFLFSLSHVFFSPKKFLGGEKSEQHSKLLIAAASNEVKILNAAGFQFKLDQFVKKCIFECFRNFFYFSDYIDYRGS